MNEQWRQRTGTKAPTANAQQLREEMHTAIQDVKNQLIEFVRKKGNNASNLPGDLDLQQALDAYVGARVFTALFSGAVFDPDSDQRKNLVKAFQAFGRLEQDIVTPEKAEASVARIDSAINQVLDGAQNLRQSRGVMAAKP